MKKTGSPKLLFEMLDLSSIRPILWWGLHEDGAGRPVEYNPEWDLRALMLRQLEQIPYVKDLVKRLSRNGYLRQVCGYQGKVPTAAHFSQVKKRIGKAGFKSIESFLRKQANHMRFQQPLLAAGLIQAACLDGTDLQAWSSRDSHDTCRGLGDREARLGRGPKGFYLGYRSLFLVDLEGFPLGHVRLRQTATRRNWWRSFWWTCWVETWRLSLWLETVNSSLKACSTCWNRKRLTI